MIEKLWKYFLIPSTHSSDSPDLPSPFQFHFFAKLRLSLMWESVTNWNWCSLTRHSCAIWWFCVQTERPSKCEIFPLFYTFFSISKFMAIQVMRKERNRKVCRLNDKNQNNSNNFVIFCKQIVVYVILQTK